MQINLKEIFGKAAVIRSLNSMEPVKSVCVDEIYKNQVKVPSVIVPIADLHTEIKAVGLTLRGGKYINLANTSNLSAQWIEVYPIRLKEPLDATTINNLKLLDNSGIETVRAQKIDKMRRTNRATTEYQAVQALSGKIEMPVTTDDGSSATYNVEYGAPLSYSAAKGWNATDAKLEDIEKDMLKMSAKVKKSGYSGIEFWAGETVWFAIAGLIRTLPNESRSIGKLEGDTIVLSAGKIKLRNEEVWSPKDNVFVPTIPAGEIMCIAKDAPHTLAYAAIDDLDGNLQPVPFFIKPAKDEETGHKLLSESKPLPAPVMKAICWCKNAIQ